MYILFLVSGNAATILKQCGIDPATVEEIKIEEKAIASFGKLRAMIQAKPYQGIIWGCRDMEYQRFQPLMKIYMLLCSKSGFIADEQGKINTYGFFSFLLKDASSLVFEIVFSVGVVLFSAVRLPLLKRDVVRKDSQPHSVD